MALLFTILVVVAFAMRLMAELITVSDGRRAFSIAAWFHALAAALVWALGRNAGA